MIIKRAFLIFHSESDETKFIEFRRLSIHRNTHFHHKKKISIHEIRVLNKILSLIISRS